MDKEFGFELGSNDVVDGTTFAADLNSPFGNQSSSQGSSENYVLDVPTGGCGELVVQYANGWSDGREATFTVDGGNPHVITFPSTGGWQALGSVIVRIGLDAGTHAISVASLNNSGPRILAIAASDGTPAAGTKIGDGLGLINALNLAGIAALALATKVEESTANTPSDFDDLLPLASLPALDSDAGIPLEEDDVAQLDGYLPPLDNGYGDYMGPQGDGGSVGSGSPLQRGSASGNGAGGSDPTTLQAPVYTEVDSFSDPVDMPMMSAFAVDEGFATAALAAEPDVSLGNLVPGTTLRLEAENAYVGNAIPTSTLGNPTAVSTTTASPTDVPNADAASGDAYVDFAGIPGNNSAGSGQYIEWTFTVDEAGFYDIDVGYAFLAAGINRSMRLDVNGKLWDRIFDMKSTDANTDYSEATTRVKLIQGENTIRLTANGFSGPNIDYLDIREADPNVIVIQAEDLAPNTTITTPTSANRAITPEFLTARNQALNPNENFRVGAEGESYLDWGIASTFAEFAVNAPTAGTYTITIVYTNGDGGSAARPLILSGLPNGATAQFAIVATNAGARTVLPSDVSDIDPTPGGSGEDANVPATASGWENWTSETITVTLPAGVSTLRLTSTTANGPNIDKIVIALDEPTVPVEPVNTAPTADDVTIGDAQEDTVRRIDITDAISDADAGDTLTVAAAVAEGQGTVVVVKDGVRTYIDFTPTPNFNGSATITYTVTDQDGAASAPATITVAVAAVNDAPVLSGSIAAQTIPATGGSFSLSGFTKSDVDGTVPTFELGDLPAGVTLSGETVNVAANVAPGTYTIQVNATDGQADSVTLSFELTVQAPIVEEPEEPVNTAPTAGNLNISDAQEDTVRRIDITDAINDVDAGDTLSVAASVPAAQGTVLVVKDGGRTYIDFTPALNFNGQATISYTVTDQADASSAPASIAVTVAAVNDAPVLTGTIPTQTVPATGGTISLSDLTSVSDVEGNATVLELTGSGPEGVSLSNGILTVAPTVAPGTYQLQIVASDGDLDSNTIPFTLTVQAPIVEEPEEPAPFTQILIQAEAGVLRILDQDTNVNDTVIRNPSNPESPAPAGTVNGLRPGLTGSGYLDFGDTPGDRATYSFTVAEAGTYDLHIRYASNSARPLAFSIDDSVPTNLAFVATGTTAAGSAGEGFNNWSIQKVTVTVGAGTHSFSLAIPAGANTGPNVDAIAITQTGVAAVFPVTNSAPIVSSETFSIVEGETAIGTIVAGDIDGDAVRYSLANASGNDNALFTINPQTGALSFIAAPDFEAPVGGSNDYTVVIVASDGALTTQKTITVTVTNDPADDVVPDTTADENGDLALSVVDISNPAAAVFAIAGADADIVSFTVSVNGGAAVAVTPVGGQITLDLGDLDPGSVAVVLTVTDGAGNSATAGATATIDEDNSAPSISSEPGFTVAENATAIGAIVATDLDGDTLTYQLSGADASKLSINANGVISLNAGANFETADDADGDGVYEATVTVSDGTTSATQDITVTVSNVNEAPTVISLSGAQSLSEDAIAGTVVGVVAGVDPEGDALTFTVSDGRFVINSTGQLAVADGATFDFAAEPQIAVTITATDPSGLSITQDFTLGVVDVAEPQEPIGMVFDPSTLTSYSPQDAGPGASVTDGGATLTLDGNLWKRAPLPESYTITEGTKITLTVTLGTNLSEIVAIGFDDDDNPFETSDRSVFQIAGTESQAAFVDLRNGNNGTPGTTFTVTIDLSAHAGKTISSLVFVADDDQASNGVGSVSFSNVQIIEGPVDPDQNVAPTVIGGGIADLTLPERSQLEIDMPFVDADGDALTYSFTVEDADGLPVAGFENLVFSQGTLSGVIQAAPSATPYTIIITADDGREGITTTEFQLTVENLNDAPVVNAIAFEPYFAVVGEEFSGIDLSIFADAFSDIDGDNLVLTVEGLPAGLSLNDEGVIVGTPTETGDGTITIVATDPSGARASFELDLTIDGPALGDVTVVEAEAFTGLDEADAFYVAAAPGASGNQAIRTNANQTGTVSTVLSENGLSEGWYEVSITVFDETDGEATFSLTIGDTVLASGLSFDDAGIFDNPSQARGNGGQVGNLKTITFTTPVFIDAATIATITGVADSGEFLRIDKLTFTSVEQPELAPVNIALDTATVAENAAGAVIGTLAATDTDGNSAAIIYTTTDERFVIEGTQLRLAPGVSFDHETSETVTVSITATDAAGLSTTSVLTIAVGDVNEAPVLGATAAIEDVTLVEGTAQTIDVAAALGATDPDAGTTLTYSVALQGGGTLPAGISLAGGVLTIAGTVAAGTYALEVLASDGTLNTAPVAFTVTVGETPAFTPIVFQAEDGAIALAPANNGNATVTVVRDSSNPEAGGFSGLRPDFSGTGYLDFGDDAGDTVTYTFTVAQAGTYDLNVRYASQDFSGAPRSLAIGVNGTVANTVFPNTGPATGDPLLQGFNFWNFLTQTVTLQAGVNTVTFAIPAGAASGPNLDRIEITEAGTGPIVVDVSADEDGNLVLSAPETSVDIADADAITLSVAGLDDDIVQVEISLDGGVTRIDVTDLLDVDGSFVFDGSALAAGTTEITVIVTDEAGNEAEATDTLTIADEETPIVVAPFTIQAEDLTQVTVNDTTATGQGALTRVVTQANPDDFGNFRTGAVGNAYMDFGAQVGDAITINVDAPAAGTYLVTFRYGNGAVDSRALNLTLNNGEVISLPFTRGPGTGDLAWNSWVEQTVELTLVEGSNQIRLAIPAGNIGGPNIDEISFEYLDGTDPVDPVEPFSLTIEAETFTIADIEAVAGTPADTVARVPGDDTNEGGANAGNSGPGQIYDSFGLRPGYEGIGYLDTGNDIGDAASFTLTAPGAGTYQLTVRFANGGTTDRPMTLTVNGVEQTIDFPSTIPASGTADAGWSNWQEITVDIELSDGPNTISVANEIANGPNIDNVTISRDGDAPVDPEVPSEPGDRETILINFQDGTAPKAPGYLVANFVGFGDRGNGYSYGFVTQASAIDADGTTATPINGAAYPAVAINERTGQGESSNVDDGRNFDSYDPRLTGYAHFDLRGTFPAGEANRVAFEVALENGWYEVTVAVGDTGGANDSNNKLEIEGALVSDFVPTNFYKTELKTVQVKVEDGFLTLAAPDGEVTEIQYLEIRELPDLTPDDGREAPEDYARFVGPRAIAGVGEGQIVVDLDQASGAITTVDPTSDIILGIEVAPNRGGALLESLTDGSIKLYETLTGQQVNFSINTTAGFDSLTISPSGGLKAFTSYTLVIDGFQDRGSNENIDAPTREFLKFSSTFTTTAQPEVEAREVAFVETIELNGYADNASLYTSIEISPDGQHLYVGTLNGLIKRWDIDPQDGSLSNEQTLELDYLQEGNRSRGIIGFVFDPTDPNVIWITDNFPVPLDGRDNAVPEFSGRVSKVTIGEGDAFTGTAETYITGLPRSNGDHVTNSLEFRANPNAGLPDEPDFLLYLIQGSNSAMGQADSAWGFRPERLLNAAILEIDPTREAPPGGFDVSTEPIPANGTNRRFGYENVQNGQLVPTDDGNLKNGGIAINSGEFTGNFLHFNADGVASVRSGTNFNSTVIEEFYNPYADDAVLKIFATGQRNGYDLVWHSNGKLYVSANGSAAGGNVPNNPNTPQNEAINNVGVQNDYFFTISEGSYSGHPNPLRDEFILNGGNPTAGTDPNQVGNYPVGTLPDPNYNADNAYSLGQNRSPNGAIEYKSNVFGTGLQNAVIFTEYSSGNDLRAMILDDDGNVIDDFVIRDPDGRVISHPDPLDVIEGPGGRLYLLTLNRSDGSSQIVRLEPAPGGIIADNTADAGGDLALVLFDGSDVDATVFQVNGLDDDIQTIRVSFNGGQAQIVTLNAQNRFTADVSDFGSPIAATLTVLDDASNTAVDTFTFTPGQAPTEFVSLIVIQAEDATPGDGTSVSTPNDVDAQIEIRSAGNLETGTGAGYVNGLRPGAFGNDGNTDNLDGTPGGYADFGSTNADFISFAFNVPSDSAGEALLRFRYANGATTDRPLQVEVNGTIVTVQSFVPTAVAPTDGWTVWSFVEIPVTLAAGQNTVTLRSVANTGPNIDQLEVLVAPDTATGPNDGEEIVDGITYAIYEAENASFTGDPAVVTTDRDQSGDFVDFVGPDTETITWTVSASAAGVHGLDILYALGAGKAARPMTLTVNGQVIETLAFTANSNAAESVWGPQSSLVNLVAGTNTITLTAPGGVGPNVDYLRVTTEPLSVFEPDYAEIVGTGRIELETTDGSANIVNGSTVDFYFTVAADGIYKLDTAANATATNGQGLTWLLNGVELDETAFPGVGTAGEESVYIQLTAGTQYQLRVISDAPGANGIDYLDVQPAPGNANADIGIQSLDPVFLDNRLHFSYLENPDAVLPDEADRDFKDTGVVRISNTGTEPLEFLESELTGPFVLANPSVFEGLTLAPGAFVDVTVLFNRAAYTPPTTNVDATSTTFFGELTLRTNDADSPIATVDLAGFWQARDEGGQEPNVNEIWQIFGFGNRIEGLRLQGGGENSTLSTNDVFAKTDDTEVLSPYWRIAEGFTQAKITQIAAFHGTGGATMGIHNPGNKGQGTTFWNHEGTDNQRLLPNSVNDNTFSTRTFSNADINDGWLGNEVFGINVAGLSTDPRLNPTGGVIVPGAQQGHTVKVFQALDADGDVIPNVYLGVMDYTGINYDYNDNLFVIEGVEPVGFGQEMVVEGLDDAAADDRLVFTNIDNPANAQQTFRNEATFTISNDGFVPLTIEDILIGNGDAFEIVGAVPTTIAAGGSAQVTVRFVGEHTGTSSGADLITSTLTIVSNDFANGQKVIQLAGLAQEFSENGSEPTVAQIVEAFGYSTDVAQGELAANGAVEAVGDEVLMPYLQRLNNAQPIEIIQIAAFLTQGNVARLGYHGLGSSDVTNLFANDDQQGQTVLPDQLQAGAGAGANVARGTINQNGPFGLYISVDGRPTYSSWTDPEANKIDPDFGQLVGDNQGHLLRFFQAIDAAGNVIEGTYIGIQDYPGAGNYDYNDHMFIIKNVQPHALTAANDANNNDVNDALENDADDDGTVDFFDPDIDPIDPVDPGSKGAYVLGVNFGGGAIANDPVLGLALVAQTDPRVTLTGSVNTGPGVDAPSNPNGAGATPGSAFATYEDGSDWTATIDVPNGTYVVTIYTQETYWNAPGQRQFDIAVNGQQVATNLDPFAEAGGDEPIAIETIVTVTNGEISIDLSADIDNAAINAVTVHQFVQPGANQTPFLGTPFLVDADGVTIDADDYDNGGQGIAYNDTAGLQGGTNGGRAGSSVEVTGGGDIGWIDNGEWLEYTINVASAGEYDLDMLLANGGGAGRAASVSFYRPGEASPYATTGTIANPSTGGFNTFVNRSADGIDLEAGTQIARVTFTGGSQDFRSFSLTPVTPVVAQTPFGGTAPSFNAQGILTVDATNFDNGGQGVAYNDNPGLDNAANGVRPGRAVEFVGTQNDIGHVLPGEWVEYTINVPAGGLYSFSVNAKSPVTGATVAVSLAGGAQLGTVTLADGHAGGSNFDNAPFVQSSEIDLALGAGPQTLRLTFNGPLASNGYVLDLRSFTLEANNLQTPFGGTAPVLDSDGLTVEGIAYDNGGQGIAYNDAAGLQGGTNGGRAGSAVEVTAGGDIGWIGGGEWLEYTINVAEAGSYLFNLSMALGDAAGPNRSVTATFTNGTAVDSVTVGTPRTGTWSNFQDTNSAEVNLDAGTTVVRLTFNGGSQDMASFSLEPAAAPAAAAAAAPMAFAATALSPFIFDEPDVSPPDSQDAWQSVNDDDGPSNLWSSFGYDLMN